MEVLGLDFTIIMAVVGVLVAITNIVVEVLKKATWDKLPTNILAVIIAEVLTLATGIAYCQINDIPMVWYIIVGFITTGFAVAYAAMFGFDKLKEVLNASKNEVSE